LGKIWTNFDEIWAKMIKIWANLIRFGQNQNLASPNSLYKKTLYGYVLLTKIRALLYTMSRKSRVRVGQLDT